MTTNLENQKKLRKNWTLQEDNKLLSAVKKHGTENWKIIAYEVGNGRNRSQCSQRWKRDLNPEINHQKWTKPEEEFLIKLIQIFGEKSWVKISKEIGNRTDVQCRFHYKNILKNTINNEEYIIERINNHLYEKIQTIQTFEFLWDRDP